jgi:hypothetical protein
MPNQSKLQLIKLYNCCSSTNLLLSPTANSSQIRSYEVSKFPCQSSMELKFKSSELHQRRPLVGRVDAWTPCAVPDPSISRSGQLIEGKAAPMPPPHPHSPCLPLALLRSGRLSRCRYRELHAIAHTYHRTPFCQITSTAPPPPHAPRRPPLWSN